MSGIYIKDMAVPKSGYVDVRIFYDGRATTQTGEHPFYREMDVLEIHPHGRLIDADALLERFEKEEKAADEHGRDFSFSFKSGGENCTEWWSVQQMLMDAPTIIEAEESET